MIQQQAWGRAERRRQTLCFSLLKLSQVGWGGVGWPGQQLRPVSGGALLRPTVEHSVSRAPLWRTEAPLPLPAVRGHTASHLRLSSIPKTARPEPLLRHLCTGRALFQSHKPKRDTGRQWRAWRWWPHTLRPAWDIIWFLLYGFLIVRGITDVWSTLKPVASHFTPICLFICSP